MSPTSLDVVNASFELGGAVLCWMDVLALYRSRTVAGVYWPSRAFFGVWGLWNLVYYAGLDQPWSCVAGALIAIANIVWALMAWGYRSRD